MLETGLYSDVTFFIEDANKSESPVPAAPPIKAHQFILRARSPVFETMFTEIWNKADDNDAARKNMNEMLEVKLVDTTYEHFVAFLMVRIIPLCLFGVFDRWFRNL
jgi:hypothetical protein